MHCPPAWRKSALSFIHVHFATRHVSWPSMMTSGLHAGERAASILQAEVARAIPVLGVHRARRIPESVLFRHRGPHLVLHSLLAGRLCTRCWQASLLLTSHGTTLLLCPQNLNVLQ